MTSLKKIDANIQTITSDTGKLNELIHITGVMIMEHAKEHGDTSRALVLAKKMPRSFRGELLIQWLHTYSPIRVIVKNDKHGLSKKTAKTYVPWDIEGAKANPFYTLEGGGSTRAPMDFTKVCQQVTNLAEQLEKKSDNGKIEDNACDAAKQIATMLKSLDFSALKPSATDSEAEPAGKAALNKYDKLDDEAVADLNAAFGGPAAKKQAA